MYIIKTGKIEFFTEDAAGNPIVHRELGEGDFFGEIALLTDRTRSTNARALTEVFAEEVPASEFDAHLDRNPDIARRMLCVMAGWLRASDDNLRGMVRPDIAQEMMMTFVRIVSCSIPARRSRKSATCEVKSTV